MYWKFPMIPIQHSVNSDWLFNTQSKVLQAGWFMLEINEKTTLNISMPYHRVSTTWDQNFAKNILDYADNIRMVIAITEHGTQFNEVIDFSGFTELNPY